MSTVMGCRGDKQNCWLAHDVAMCKGVLLCSRGKASNILFTGMLDSEAKLLLAHC